MAWAYEILFDVEDLHGMTPLEAQAQMDEPQRWKSETPGMRKGQMGYRTRTTKAGPRLECEIYPLFGREDEGRAREAKKRVTPEKIQQYNDEKARRRLINLMDANFGAGDLSLGLTWDGAEPTWSQAVRDIRNFIDRIRRLRRKRKLPELKYIYAVENEGPTGHKRIHAHLITQGDTNPEGTEKTRQELKWIWEDIAGRRKEEPGFCNIDILQPTKEGLEAIARYIYDQNKGSRRDKNRRKYSCSKNLRKPKTRTSDTKVSRGKVSKMAAVFGNDETAARRIMEKLYPGYEFVRGTAKGSDIIDGIYIRVLMRRRK